MSTSRRWSIVAARVLIALPFVISGLNKLLHFLPVPPFSAGAGALMGAFAASGYLLPLIAAVEVGAGALLLAGRQVPLALLLLAPVTVNVVAFHLFLEPASLPLPLFLVAAQAYLAWAHRAAFAPLFGARASGSPAAAAPAAAEIRAAA